MSANEPAPGLTACLTDREMEILRLLVAGHTVKTIAARLGRSETSINERLRAARRKTGVGSSRELARLLDLQKTCDENIDLSRQRPNGKDLAYTAAVGGRGSKGMIIMLIAIPMAAAGLMFAAAPSADQAGTPNAVYAAASKPLPLVGSWSLDASQMPEKERPQRVTMTFRPSADGKWTTRVEIIAPDGSSKHSESTAALDGVAVPITGNMDFIDSVALRQPAPDTLVMTLGKAGARVSTRVYTVAKDLKSMTETIVWSADNRQKLETTHFDRID
ncbi:DNA-binding CsgD family transcriptional regulator [Sphingopyxis sp. OAS728]|uniref:helix-turn-helix domain-containing protein n=1 Tax=Sphingopyxis sp. OAS728 TaxID=2663823 RepID=UPI001A057510|nr:helix-turn-helix transcriptional regulator [Sphingopyxis sp. OAS728]MBE1525681.1 DNA-binding CsgD family transcriptional regulator [Sphingopyxis sp. OAS728]